MKWIFLIKDYNPGASLAPTVGASVDPASAVAEGVFMELKQELVPDELLMPQELFAPDSFEDEGTGCSQRSHHLRGDCQEGSRTSSVDSVPVKSWWDTSSELDLRTDSTGFSYTSFCH